ncbi:MAG: Asp23/Gls24 family envelope stress response protein [Clostridia bacterium]|nr:Asp23/Gls24 family envelope stress response protein [Clostridia bacterium]MBR2070883.1 Asp23/Gls24 family envelope stress response protein [Clostridia bacterium]MBR2160335.1 Asp23/Gls24 family envelope stress response protein [Clostridia bacterium]MBR2496216.1 Asp23/Gls24 family envelope stress response protein [Clostridia bacterium]MBR2875070.1 Asp23/Gls24 family envelope stress response protein [Clostridia bacterium]
MEIIKNSKGKTTYNNSIITNIAILALAEVDGIAPSMEEKDDAQTKPEKFLQKIKIDFEENNVYVDLSIYVYEGCIVPDVAFKVQEAVKSGIENMTTFKAKSVDVRVLGVKMKGERKI